MTMQTSASKPFQWRAFTTFYVVLSFLVISVTGIVLFITPPGRIANWSDWRFLGFSKEQWQTVHTVFAFIFVVAASFHLYFNWKVILGYLARRFREGINKRRELAGALTAGTIILVMAADGTPPFGALMAWGEDIKNSWSTPAVEPPVPHAELLTLQGLADAMHIPPDQLASRLAAAGITADSAGMLIRDLAKKHNLAPKDLYDRIGAHGAPAVRAGTGGGYGRKTVAEICTEAGIAEADGLLRLRAAGIDASSGATIRTLAQNGGLSPTDIVAIIRGHSPAEHK